MNLFAWRFKASVTTWHDWDTLVGQSQKNKYFSTQKLKKGQEIIFVTIIHNRCLAELSDESKGTPQIAAPNRKLLSK